MKSPQLISSSMLLLGSLLFASCGGGGALVSSGATNAGSGGAGGNSNAGNGGDGSISFAMTDLDGDWTGELIPDMGSDVLERNFYMRLQDGLVNDCVEGGGGIWSEADANVSLTFRTDGSLDVQLTSNGVEGKLSLEGTMNLAMTKINGTFSLQPDLGSVFSGTFELRRSSGSGHFTIDLLAGAWEGKGSNPEDRFRFADLSIDANGDLISASISHPVTDAIVHTYSAGTTSFEFFDTAVGRMNNVVFHGNDGSTLTFEFMLVNDDGTLMGGPAVDTLLGAGHAELIR